MLKMDECDWLNYFAKNWPSSGRSVTVGPTYLQRTVPTTKSRWPFSKPTGRGTRRGGLLTLLMLGTIHMQQKLMDCVKLMSFNWNLTDLISSVSCFCSLHSPGGKHPEVFPETVSAKYTYTRWVNEQWNAMEKKKSQMHRVKSDTWLQAGGHWHTV